MAGGLTVGGVAVGQVDLELIDPYAGEVRNADLIFIFGTRHWTAAELAADLYHAGRAPFVVVTGGPQRHPRGVSEAEVHQRLLLAAGVPEDAVIVENQSTTTVENVTLSAPLIAQAVGPVRTAIAVVKWYHRRALVTLAAQAPHFSRIYAADYEPLNADSRTFLGRSNWRETGPASVERETRTMRELAADGYDMLQRTDAGWIRSTS
jgi:hypothetical protein